MQKYEETHQFVISMESERKKKKQEENEAIGGVKVHLKWQSRNESNWLINVAVLGFAQSSYEVATSGKLKEFDAGRDRDHKIDS